MLSDVGVGNVNVDISTGSSISSIISSTSNANKVSSVGKQRIVRMPKLGWPVEFIIQDEYFPAKLVKELDRGRSFLRKEESTITSGIYDQISNYVGYCKHRQYTHKLRRS